MTEIKWQGNKGTVQVGWQKEDKMTETEMIVTYNGVKYKRIIVSSSHSRTQKAMLVSVDVWDKAMDILLCGLDRNTKYKYMSRSE